MTEEKRDASELEEGLDHLGKAVTGVLTKLLGEGVTGQELDPERPVLSPEADRALEKGAHKVGRWLFATGRALKDHPADPVEAFEEAARTRHEAPEPREGETVLTEGLRALGGGVYRSAEALLDKVAPRKAKPNAAGAGEE